MSSKDRIKEALEWYHKKDCHDYYKGDNYKSEKHHSDKPAMEALTILQNSIVIDNWKPVDAPLPFGHYLVTNNINARGKNGAMSHVWHTNMVHETKEIYGPFTAFYGTNDAKVWGVTHYIDLSPVTSQLIQEHME